MPSPSKMGHGQTPSQAHILAHRASLGRIVSLVVNERIVQATFKVSEGCYYISPLTDTPNDAFGGKDRFVISGTPPFLSSGVTPAGDVIPALMHESNITIGMWSFQQQQFADDGGILAYVDVDNSITAAGFVHVLRSWMGWDQKLTAVLEDRIHNSAQYLEDEYLRHRPCPTLESDYITWEQSIVEANGHPLHKCRMPVDPKTQPMIGFDFKKTRIAFMVVHKSILEIHGPLGEELQPLIVAAGIDTAAEIKGSEMIIPVHAFQVDFLLKMAQSKAPGALRLLEQTVAAYGQSSTRTMSVPGLAGLGVKLSLSIIIGDNIRTINKHSAFSAVRYWTLGMLDPAKVSGLRDSPLEIAPEVACANGLDDHLAVMIRWDHGHPSRPVADATQGYAVSGAICEPASPGSKGCVAESVFGLDTCDKKLAFLRQYVRLYFQCFLKPLFTNSLLLDAHGQNSLLRYSRSTGQLLGFSARDMSGTRFNGSHFERTTGITPDERMSNHDMPVPDLMQRAHFIFFVAHLAQLVMALGLSSHGPASFTSAELLIPPGDRVACIRDKEAADLARGNGWAVIARELHESIASYENGADAGSRELASEARKIWLDAPTWPLQAFISQRMRADWADRKKDDKLSHIEVTNLIVKVS